MYCSDQCFSGRFGILLNQKKTKSEKLVRQRRRSDRMSAKLKLSSINDERLTDKDDASVPIFVTPPSNTDRFDLESRHDTKSTTTPLQCTEKVRIFIAGIDSNLSSVHEYDIHFGDTIGGPTILGCKITHTPSQKKSRPDITIARSAIRN